MTPETTPLLHRAHTALIRNPHLLGRKLFLESDGEQIILRGNVDSFYEKQVAQETLRLVDNGVRISNQLIVRTTLRTAN